MFLKVGWTPPPSPLGVLGKWGWDEAELPQVKSGDVFVCLVREKHHSIELDRPSVGALMTETLGNC